MKKMDIDDYIECFPIPLTEEWKQFHEKVKAEIKRKAEPRCLDSVKGLRMSEKMVKVTDDNSDDLTDVIMKKDDEAFKELERRLVREIQASPAIRSFKEQLEASNPDPLTEEQVMQAIDTLQSMWRLLAQEVKFEVERSRCFHEILTLIASLEYLQGKIHSRGMNEMRDKEQEKAKLEPLPFEDPKEMLEQLKEKWAKDE